MTLTLSLLLFAAPGECAVDDHACKVDHFAALAAQTTDPELRAQRLYASHRSAMFLHQKTGEPAALCRARALLDQTLAIDPRPAGLATPLRKAEAELHTVESTAHVDCAPKRPPRKPVAARPAPPPPSPPPTPRRAELIDPPPTPPEHDLLPVAAHPTAPAPAPLPPRTTRRPPARIAGGVTLLLASAGLAAGMGASLHQRAEVLAGFRDLKARITDRDATPDEYAQAAAANHRYGNLTVVAGLTGAAATASLLAGAILLATTPRRARLLAVPWTLPRSAGLSLRARF